MEQLEDVIELIRQQGLVKGHLRGLFHLAIGRTLSRPDGHVISRGVSWRNLAAILRDLRLDPDLVRELGLDPATLPPRDRLKYWYTAIAGAKIDSPAGYTEAEKLAEALKPLGILVSPPGSGTSPGKGPTPGSDAPAGLPPPPTAAPKPGKRRGKAH